MNRSKAVEIMMQLKAEYFYAFKEIPDNLFKIKIDNFMKALEDYSDNEIDVALGIVLAQSKTVPCIANFIEVLEENRELFYPRANEEWLSIEKVLEEMETNSKKFFSPYVASESEMTEIDFKNRQKKAYNKLSDMVKKYYVNYENFIKLRSIEKIEFEKARFLKEFTEFRKRETKKSKILKKIGGKFNEE